MVILFVSFISGEGFTSYSDEVSFLIAITQTKKAGYYTIEMTAEKEVRALGQILPDGRHESLGEAPVEGAELQKIMDLARYDGTEMTS